MILASTTRASLLLEALAYAMTDSYPLVVRETYPSTFAPPIRPPRPIVPRRPRPTRRFYTQTIGHAGRMLRI